jgi:hypothetical protein
MSAVDYEEFFPYVQPYVASCPDASLVIAIRSACIEFCEETNFLNDTIEEQVIANEATYELSVPTGYALSHIMEMYVGGLKLVKQTPLILEKLFNGMDWMSMPGPARYYTQLNTDEVRLCPVPDVEGSMTGRYAYAPLRTSTSVDERVFNDYVEVIAEGALARIFGQPDQPYTNPQARLMAERKFMSGIANAKAYVRGGMSASTEMHVRFRRIW